jgi:two-component sensor histidine kinase
MAIALKEDRPIRGAEAVAERPDGTRIPFIPFPTPLHDASGKLVGAINMLVDISERKRSEEQLLVLVNELNHRVKNTLATVQSIAAQTFRSTSDPAAFRPAFEARLMALSNAHELLTRHSWAGVSLRELCEQALAPHAEDGGRIRLSGAALRLEPRVALAFGMILHELATNAAKYGALSAGEGIVSIDWTLAPREAARWIELTWRERGGPAVRQPTRNGFGLQLIERSVVRDLAGDVALQFESDGFACKIAVPYAQA